jgi:hypothetical protein
MASPRGSERTVRVRPGAYLVRRGRVTRQRAAARAGAPGSPGKRRVLGLVYSCMTKGDGSEVA